MLFKQMIDHVGMLLRFEGGRLYILESTSRDVKIRGAISDAKIGRGFMQMGYISEKSLGEAL